MLTFVLGVVVGVLVGWHLPKPAFVTTLIEKVKGLVVKK